MSDIRDQGFLNWYTKKDFTVLEQMTPKFHREYYCRSAWFSRDTEIESLQSQLKAKDEIIKRQENRIEAMANIFKYMNCVDKNELINTLKTKVAEFEKGLKDE